MTSFLLGLAAGLLTLAACLLRLSGAATRWANDAERNGPIEREDVQAIALAIASFGVSIAVGAAVWRWLP